MNSGGLFGASRLRFAFETSQSLGIGREAEAATH